MNYGRRGLKKRLHERSALPAKIGHKFSLILIQLFIIAVISACVIGAAAGIGLFKGILSSAPDISHIDVSPTGFSTFAYDTEGHQMAKLVAADSNRIPVSMSQIPEDLAHAFVAIEDERFYEHNGIDIKGIMRAGMIALKNRDLSQGASTITQQLLKNNVFQGWTNETQIEKIKRKIQEQYLAIELEKVMDKDKILENYMNTINLGQNTLGVQAASLRYFNKPVYELKLSECAVIAAITQNPSRYNPISHPDNNKKRRDTTLSNMLEQGYINKEQYDRAMADDVYSRIKTVNETVEAETINSYFVDALTEDVLFDLVNVAGYNETQAYNLLYTGGLSIYTTQDAAIQKIADDVFSNEENFPSNTKWYLNYELSVEEKDGSVKNYSTEMYKAFFQETNSRFNLLYESQEDAYAAIDEFKAAVIGEGESELAERVALSPQPQMSLVIEEQSTGNVVAMVGGRGPKEASRTLNRATDTARQPGSTFKVLSAYAPAFDSAGLTLGDVKMDAPYNYQDGRPVSNWYSSGYRGLCTLREGIRDSLNIIAVKTLTQISPQLGYDYLLNFGFTTLKDRYEVGGVIYSDIQQSLALGGITLGVTNEELNAAYASIANAGVYNKPRLYTKIVDHGGNVIIDRTEPESRRVIKETTAFLLTDAMVDVVTSGTGGSVRFPNMSIAGKTGTTSDYNDVWFAGYTPYYTATTWCGFDNNEKLKGDEKNLAKVIWKKVMEPVHEGLENKPFVKPAGIVTAIVCARSGKLPIPGLCEQTLRTEYFAEDTMPSTPCNVHYSGMVCAYSMLPASDECPFKVPGALELTPDDEAPIPVGGSEASAGNTTDPTMDPLHTGETAEEPVIDKCPHNAEFYMRPDAEIVIAQQSLELQTNAQAVFAQTPAAAQMSGAAQTPDAAQVPVPTPGIPQQ